MESHDYRVETTVQSGGSVVLEGLPFSVGEQVEVIVRPRVSVPTSSIRYPLRGTPITFIDPTAPVCTEDLEAAVASAVDPGLASLAGRGAVLVGAANEAGLYPRLKRLMKAPSSLEFLAVERGES